MTEPGSLTLVRNPSWDPASDDLRAALPDRIELALGGDPADLAAAVEAGELDMVFGASATAEQVHGYQDDPAMAKRVFVHPNDTVFYATMNLAVPPFDDVHVRRAVNLAVDKEALVEWLAQPPYGPFGLSVGFVATHLAPDSLEGNLLHGYEPYPYGIDDARAEMRLSGYDGDEDGRCDATACREVLALALQPARSQARSIQRDLAAIGIDLDLDVEPVGLFFRRLSDPAERIPIGIGAAWAQDYPNASTWFPTLFASEHIGINNYSVVGASPEQLREWGYAVTSVPSVDDRVDRCLALLGSAQIGCWAELDRYLMAEIVPWVPYLTLAHAQIVSERVIAYSFDQFAGQPALDRIELAPGVA